MKNMLMKDIFSLANTLPAKDWFLIDTGFLPPQVLRDFMYLNSEMYSNTYAFHYIVDWFPDEHGGMYERALCKVYKKRYIDCKIPSGYFGELIRMSLEEPVVGLQDLRKVLDARNLIKPDYRR